MCVRYLIVFGIFQLTIEVLLIRLILPRPTVPSIGRKQTKLRKKPLSLRHKEYLFGLQ